MERLIASFILLFFLGGCAQTPSSVPEFPYSLQNSVLFIRYTMGDDIYDYRWSAFDSEVTAEVKRNDIVIEREKISWQRYQHLAVLTNTFMAQTKNKADVACVNPYRISFQTKEMGQEIFSCRSRDVDGEFGRFIREIEILLYTE